MAANSQFSKAVHILTLLAQSDGEMLKSDQIAASVNTNPVVIRRLLGQLQQSGLVTSHSGAAGGSRLARCPDKIFLSEVYNAVSAGEVFALPTRTPNKDCPVGRNIEAVLCGLQKEIDKAVDERLSKYSLKCMIESIEKN